MPKVVACIDGSVYSPSVADHAGWAASRLRASVAILNVEERGRATVEAKRWLDIEEASARVEAFGLRDVAPAMRAGGLREAMLELEGESDLLTIGKRGASADFSTMRLGSNLEGILRGAAKPVLVASRAFKPIRRYLIAYDDRPSARKAVEAVATSPLFEGMPGGLLTVGSDTPEVRRALEAAAARLAQTRPAPEIRIATGTTSAAIAEALLRDDADLLVMGAYGHSRLRTMMIGSTTSATIRASAGPVLIYS
jgi:nucleotide-binding universal stress UspA family protein